MKNYYVSNSRLQVKLAINALRDEHQQQPGGLLTALLERFGPIRAQKFQTRETE